MLIHINEIQRWINENLEFQFKNISRFWIEWYGTMPQLRCQFNVPNAADYASTAYPHGATLPVTHTVPLPLEAFPQEGGGAMILEEYLVKYMFRAVGQFVVHEFAETFLCKGVREFNPHDGNRNEYLWEGVNKASDVPRNSSHSGFMFNPWTPDHYAPVKPHPNHRPEQQQQAQSNAFESYSYKFEFVIPSFEPVLPEPEEPKTGLDKYRAIRKKSMEHFQKFFKGNDSDWHSKKFKKGA